MGFTPQDVGEYIHGVAALSNAAGTTAGTAVNGPSVDRFGFTSGRYHSCKIVVPFNYAITSGVTIAVNAHIQDSPTSTAWTNHGSTASTAGSGGSVTGSTGGSTGNDAFQRSVDLTGAERYVRVRVTPNVSVVSSVNSMNYSGVIVFGGADEYPAS